MAYITVSDKDFNQSNLLYLQNSLYELFKGAGCTLNLINSGSRCILKINCPENYVEIVQLELADKIADIVVVNYKYSYFKENVRVSGLTSQEKEILLASLIAADLEDDKRYTVERYKGILDIAIDGIFNFRLKPLKKKWSEVVSCMPNCFINSQLKEFVNFLLENKSKRVYIESGRVYDCHYRRLIKSALMEGDNLLVIKEVLLSNCGEIRLSGDIPKEDEYYLKEFYSDKIYFSSGYFS